MSRAMFGSISLKNQSYLEFYDASDTNYIRVEAPSSVATDAVLTLPDITDTLVSLTATQTLTNKTISGLANTLTNLPLTSVQGILAAVSGGTGVNSTATYPLSGTIPTDSSTDTFTNKSISGSTNTLTGISLTASVTGTLPIANGGTGAATALASFDALSPLTTAGDLLYYNGTHNARLGVGSTGYILTVVAGEPAWAAPGTSGTYAATWTTGEGASFEFNHNLGTTDVGVVIYDIATGATIGVDSEVRTDANNVTLTASSAPPAGSWRVLIFVA